jgi:hypothetical protein
MHPDREHGRPVRLRVPLLLALLPLLGCDPPGYSDVAVSVRDSAGIRIVENLRQAPRTLTVEPEVRIGSVGGDDAYTFGRLSALAVAADGRMVALDGQARLVRVFSAEGAALARMGGPGEGPSELHRPARMWLGGDTVFVHDGGNRKLAMYSLDGAFLDSRPLGAGPGAPIHGTLDPVGDGRFMSVNIMGCLEPGETRSQTYRALTDADGIITDSIPVRSGGSFAMVMVDRMCVPVSLPFAADLHLERGPDGTWAMGDGSSYDIQLGRIAPADSREAGASLQEWFETDVRVRRSHQPRPLTAEERRIHRDSHGAAAAEQHRRSVVAALADMEYPSVWPAYHRLRLDDDGRLWVLRTPEPLLPHTPSERASPRELRHYDVYDRSGTLLFELTMGAAMSAARGEHVYAIVTDPDLDMHFIQRFRMADGRAPGPGRSQ